MIKLFSAFKRLNYVVPKIVKGLKYPTWDARGYIEYI